MTMDRISIVEDVIILVNFVEDKHNLIVKLVFQIEIDYLPVNFFNLNSKKFH